MCKKCGFGICFGLGCIMESITTEYCCKMHGDSNRIINVSYNSKCVCSLDCKYSHIHDAVNQLSSFCKCDQKTVSDITLGKIGRFHGWD